MKSDEIDLNKLRTFFVIAERGGVSAAAEQLSLTRSAVSHSLASLEDALGLPLFHRVGRKLVLTREGEGLRRAYRDVDARLATALDEVGNEAGEVRGWIRLGLYPGFSRLRLADVLERFLTRHPLARVRLVHGSRSELQARLLDGRLDFALSLRSRDPRDSRRMRSTQLFEQSLVLAGARSLLSGGRGSAKPDAVAQLPIVDYFRSEPLIDRWRRHHFGRRRLPRANVVVWTGSGTDVALELTRRGVGACVLPHDLVAAYAGRGGELRIVRGMRSTLRDGIWLNEIEAVRTSPIQSAFKQALL